MSRDIQNVLPYHIQLRELAGEMLAPFPGGSLEHEVKP